MALRSPVAGAEPLAPGAEADEAAGVLAATAGLLLALVELLVVELFLLEQPLKSTAAAIVTTPATWVRRRRRSEVTKGPPGQAGYLTRRGSAGIARPPRCR